MHSDSDRKLSIREIDKVDARGGRHGRIRSSEWGKPQGRLLMLGRCIP